MTLKFIPTMKGVTATITPLRKPKLKVADAKRLAKAMEKIGKTVTGVEARPDGSIAVSVADPATQHAAANEWDEILGP